VPKFDPVASLRIWAVEVDLAGRVLRIPPLPAADWLPIVMRLDLNGLLDLADEIEIDELLLDGVITYEQLQDALTLLLEGAAGRPAWTTFALAHLAAEHWRTIGGDLARRGVQLGTLPLGGALDAIYGSLAAHMDEKGLAELHRVFDKAPDEPATPSRRYGPVPASAEQYVRVRPKTVQRRPQDPRGAPSAPPTALPDPPADSDLGGGSVSPSPGLPPEMPASGTWSPPHPTPPLPPAS
jgi:hypothetical protein